MIKANVISDHLNWIRNIENPNDYLNKRLKILSKAPFFKRKNHEFSVLLTNNKKMKKLNFKFRKKNKTTDVLSFPIKIKNKSSLYVGDIAISYEIIKNRSKKLLGHLNEISVVDFDHKDVVRHPLVSKIVKAYSEKSTE